MGALENISASKFPKQGGQLGKQVKVCFHSNADITLNAEVVRDDREEPFRTIFRLENGNYVLASECHWQPAEE